MNRHVYGWIDIVSMVQLPASDEGGECSHFGVDSHGVQYTEEAVVERRGVEGPGSTVADSATGIGSPSPAPRPQPAVTTARATNPKHKEFMVDDLSAVFRYLQLFNDICMSTGAYLIPCARPNMPAHLVGRSRVVASAR